MLRSLTVIAALAFAAPAFAQSQAAAPAAPPRPPPVIDGAALAGPAPNALSPRQSADTLAMHPVTTPERLAQARADQAFAPWSAMAPVFGETFTAERLPATKRVFDRLLAAIGPVSASAKNAYARRRPFLENSAVLQCDQPTPDLAASGSYPSGHAMAGWSWALLLAELVPARADAILQRGRDYGDSRVICGFHYPSDIEAGRALAAGVVARLHGDTQFRRDMDGARRELARAYPG